jgi:hypothetical protein
LLKQNLGLVIAYQPRAAVGVFNRTFNDNMPFDPGREAPNADAVNLPLL